MEDAKIQSELERLHQQHLARKGQGEHGNATGADDATFVEAEQEARADANNEKGKEMRQGPL